MNDDEKIAHYKEEIAKIRRKKKAEREKERRVHAKENRKIINDLLDKHGYNPMNEKCQENTIKYFQKYGDKLEYFIKNGDVEKKGKKNDLSNLES